MRSIALCLIAVLCIPILATEPMEETLDVVFRDSICLKHRMYGAIETDNAVASSIVGTPLGKTNRRLADYKHWNVARRSGDAALLPPGTIIYSVKGYKNSFRIMVKKETEWVIYEVYDNDASDSAMDYFDIIDKINVIELRSQQDSTRLLGTISDPSTINSLTLLLFSSRGKFKAPETIEESVKYVDEPQIQLAFVLKDGTSVVRHLGLHTCVFGGTFVLPREFCAIIQQALLAHNRER